MFKKNNKHNKSQAILDFILAFGVLLALLMGLVRIWIWFDANYAKRNVDYQNTRLAAGTANDSHKTALAYQDQLLKIDDKWVFNGQASGTVGMPPATTTVIDVLSGEGGSDGSEAACNSAKEAATALRTQADNMDAQADSMYDFIKWGDEWWKPLFSVFMALGIKVSEYKDAIKQLRQGATDARTQATEMENGVCGATT